MYDILEDKMIQLLGALYSSEPAHTLEEPVSRKAAPLIFLCESHWLPNEQSTPLSQAFSPWISKLISFHTVIFQLTSQVIKTIFQYSSADISYSSVGVNLL